MATTSARARFSVCGWAYSRKPLMSRTPRTWPVAGSRTGTAAQCHFCHPSQKCSAPTMWVASPVARAVPGPLVPTMPSDQSPPGRKLMEARPSSAAGSPSAASMRASWSNSVRMWPTPLKDA